MHNRRYLQLYLNLRFYNFTNYLLLLILFLSIGQIQTFDIKKYQRGNCLKHIAQMSKQKQLSLLKQFNTKCQQQLGKLPESYWNQFIKDKTLIFNLDLFKLEDQKFALIIFSLPFKEIRITANNQYRQNQNKYHSQQQRIFSLSSQSQQEIGKLLNSVNQALFKQPSQKIRALQISNIPIKNQYLFRLFQGIEKTKYLKNLTIKNCELKDDHIQILEAPLSANISIKSLDFSFNQLNQCGKAIRNVLSQHAKRKDQLKQIFISKRKIPQFDIVNTGLLEINLQNNFLSNQSLDQLITFLSQDQWIRYLNLKNNNIDQQTVQKFTNILGQNQGLLNLDLRENPGFTAKYSKLIFLKLKQNIKNMKKTSHKPKQKKILKNKLISPSHHVKNTGKLSCNQGNFSQLHLNQRRNSNSFLQFNKQSIFTQSNQNASKQKKKIKMFIHSSKECCSSANLSDFQQTMTDKKNNLKQKQRKGIKKKSLVLENQSNMIRMNKTVLVSSLQSKESKNNNNKQQLIIFESQTHNFFCNKCQQYQVKILQTQHKYKEMQLRALKAEKQNIQLEIELRKLRNFLSKNMDVSAIVSSSNKLNLLQNIPPLPSNIQNSNISTSFNRLFNTENQEDMLSRIQIMVSELTRIMETVEAFQNTEYTIQNPFQNVNSFSKTVSLYEKPKQMLQVQQQIQQDEALHLEQFGNHSQSIVQRSQTYESIFKIDKNQLQTPQLYLD